MTCLKCCLNSGLKVRHQLAQFSTFNDLSLANSVLSVTFCTLDQQSVDIGSPASRPRIVVAEGVSLRCDEGKWLMILWKVGGRLSHSPWSRQSSDTTAWNILKSCLSSFSISHLSHKDKGSLKQCGTRGFLETRQTVSFLKCVASFYLGAVSTPKAAGESRNHWTAYFADGLW